MATVVKSISAAPAWLANTAHDVGNHVENDASKVYICTTAGTSAASGGPTGTGTGITDGTAVWDYVLTRDYSTLQSWADAAPADLVTATTTWRGECYNHAEFTGSLSISGITADASNYVHLTAAAGESVFDTTTNPLNYDVSKGVGVAVDFGTSTDSVLNLNVGYTLVDRLQWKATKSGLYGGKPFGIGQTAKLKDCLLDVDMRANSGYVLRARSAYGANPGLVYNVLIVNRTDRSSDNSYETFRGEGGTFINCGAVIPTGLTNPNTGEGFLAANNTPIAKNCYAFGFNTDFSGSWDGANSDYNASDSTNSPGVNSVDSLTYADQFVSTTVDWKLKSGSGLVGAGNTDATNVPSDIFGTVRGVGTAGDIGPHEYVAGDTTPPSLTNPTGTKTGSSTADGTVDTDDANGTMYAIADTSGTAPDVTQIQAGQGSDGAAGDWSGNQAISSTGTKTFSATGLVASTPYYFYFQHKDAAGNNSTVSASTSFTTDAFSGSNDISWKLFDTLSESLAWKLFSDSTQQTAYSIFNDSSQAVAARIFTELSNATGWKLFSEGSQASGAKILAESTVDSAWSIFSSSSSQDIAWAILTSGTSAQSVAWRIVNALQQDTAARILNDAQRSSSWAILSGLSQDVGWGILTTAQQDALWKILTSGNRDSGWPILNDSSQASSWGILAAQLQASGWKIYSEGALDSAWNIDGVQKVGSIILKAQSRDNYILEAKDRALIVDAKNRILIIKAKPLI